MKVGVFTGKFKPPHKGHKQVIDRALAENDHVRVFVSKNPEDGIDAETAIAIFREYFGETSKIKYVIAPESPVKSAYKFVSDLGQWEKAGTVDLTLYSAAEDMKRWDHIGKFLGNIKSVNKVSTERPSFGDGILHAEDMRKFLAADDFESFEQGVPDGADSKRIWDILKEAMTVSADSYRLKKKITQHEPNTILSNRFGYPTIGTTTFVAENRVDSFSEFTKKKK